MLVCCCVAVLLAVAMVAMVRIGVGSVMVAVLVRIKVCWGDSVFAGAREGESGVEDKCKGARGLVRVRGLMMLGYSLSTPMAKERQ